MEEDANIKEKVKFVSKIFDKKMYKLNEIKKYALK